MSTISPSRTARPRALWVLSFLAFFLVFGAWSVAAPYDGTPDEMQHMIRAAGVAGGQIAPEPVRVKGQSGTIQNVPAGLNASGICWTSKPLKSAECAPQPSSGPLVDTPTLAGRYHPLYYAAVGWPLRIWDGWAGILVARLMSAALSAALLSWAFMILTRWSRFGLMLGGLVAVSTPMLAQIAGAVNPNGLEISAGIALAAAGIPLLMGPRRGDTRQLYWLVGISIVLLASLRSMGPLFLGTGLLAMLLPVTRRRAKELLANHGRPIRVLSVITVVSVALAAAWIVLMNTGDLTSPPPKEHLSGGQAVIKVFAQWGQLLQEMVGYGGWLDTAIPPPFYWIWLTIAASLVVFALVVGTRADRWRILVIAIGGALIPTILQAININIVGYITQGRYMLPAIVFLPLLGAFIVEQRLLTARQSHSFTKLCVVAMLPIHLVLLWYTMVRWQRGIPRTPTLHALDPFWGPWHPVLGSLTPLLAMSAGLLLLGGLVLWASARTVARPAPADATEVIDVADVPADLTAPEKPADPIVSAPESPRFGELQNVRSA
ncbi:hypothetical protein Lfu02_47720 [Longispora fulva]|uniref:Uncharacterized protein n=1 Tax=Longispora fulva TaxID=619741 RepID=A0A8J7KR38_9ACTN|nr:DUF2142 domain-containing protein [Longispora fulva]MBG6138147.1 hypothetical protein [Longispora fulva]GIG60400.1 hypothetical protein Lfu02_47720 [Longispora fulva]